MDKKELERLKFRKQYLLIPADVECPFQHHRINMEGNYILYHHPDLNTTIAESGERKMILLGDLFDYRKPLYHNGDILKELSTLGTNSLLQEIGAYTGKYVLVVQEGSDLWILNDPITARKVFYSNLKGKTWIASQPHLLALILGLETSRDAEKIKFYSSREFNILLNSNIGDTTLYDEIKQLRANHYLRLSRFEIKRFWPLERIEQKPMKEVAEKCANLIEGYMTSIVNRYEVMLPVTSGKDSRTLLAATRKFPQKPFFYLNYEERMNETHPDLVVPKKLLSRLDLDFHILDPSFEVDKHFEKVYFENNKYASHSYLPHIYNYYLNFEGRINLPGNMPTAAFEVYGADRMSITGMNLAKLTRVENYAYAENYYEQWISESREYCQSSGIHMLHLFYWEERLGNWGTQIQLDKEITQDDINLFNSRDLASLYLSVKSKYIKPPFYRLQRQIIRNLWPELLTFPINPGYHTTILKILKVTGILNIYRRLKY